jgi:hypothetical protein
VQGWGGGFITIVRGEGEGGRKRDSLSRESKELKGASDVELGGLFFFGLVTKMAGAFVWTPYQQMLQEAQKAHDKAIAESYKQLRNLLSGNSQS